MIEEDIKTLARISKALWVDTAYSESSILETISAVSLLDLTPDRALEKASIAILQKARKKGVLTNSEIRSGSLLGNQFYRLLPDERFLLVALHLGHWSYLRLGRIMNVSSEEIQEAAWRLRVILCTPGVYPAGPAQLSSQCPEYDFLKPWTQRFLDDEVSSASDRVFLQTHLMACESCSKLLARCRDLYYKVDRIILDNIHDSNFESSLGRILLDRPIKKPKSEVGFIESVRIFFRRWDVKLAFFVLLTLVLFKVKLRLLSLLP